MMHILSFLLLWNTVPANDADILLGVWYNGEKDAKIEIYHCGDKYCGKIIWLEEPNEVDGTSKIDDENPDVALQKRPIMGLNILEGFIYTGEKTWEEGTIYNPRDGKTYSCYMTLLEDGMLKVRGFWGISLIGKTQYWERTQ